MCRILVIDDEEAVRSAVKRRLERDGYEVDTAESQAEGMEAIRDAQPAVRRGCDRHGDGVARTAAWRCFRPRLRRTFSAK